MWGISSIDGQHSTFHFAPIRMRGIPPGKLHFRTRLALRAGRLSGYGDPGACP